MFLVWGGPKRIVSGSDALGRGTGEGLENRTGIGGPEPGPGRASYVSFRVCETGSVDDALAFLRLGLRGRPRIALSMLGAEAIDGDDAYNIL